MNKETIESAISGALSSRGKSKGQLKAKCPSVNTPEAAAWLAIMSHVNPYKVGMAHLMFMSEANQDIFNAIDKAMDNLKPQQYIGLDKDRLALEAWGVW